VEGFGRKTLIALLWVFAAVQLVLLVTLGLEALICVIVALPYIALMPWLGILFGWWLYGKVKESHIKHLVIFFALLPYGTHQLEVRFPPPQSLETVKDEIVFKEVIDPEIVWRRVASVEAIDPATVPDKWVYSIGFPKLLSASLDREGVGGIRVARFEKGVSFFETVTLWQPPHKIRFTIHADPEFIPASAFDRHIIIGSRLFDVIDGGYDISSDGTNTTLRLVSHHRISTWFNWYTRIWSHAIMHEIQQSIMGVLKRRIERDHLLSSN